MVNYPNEYILTNLKISEYNIFIGKNFYNIKRFIRDIKNELKSEVNLFIRILKANNDVKIKWNDVSNLNKELLYNTIIKVFDDEVNKFNNKQIRHLYNFRFGVDPYHIKVLLRERGEYHKKFVHEMKEKYKLKYLNISIQTYNDTYNYQYRMLGFDNQCEEISYNTNSDKVTIDRFGKSIILLCNMIGPKDLKIIDIENEVTRYVLKNTGLFNEEESDEEEEYDEKEEYDEGKDSHTDESADDVD